ncbi:MAG: hypothetical protein JKY37_31705 [Nannocystaceae bacterium]|nr:hypothetical protein [Nannocystaceae bacterium]
MPTTLLLAAALVGCSSTAGEDDAMSAEPEADTGGAESDDGGRDSGPGAQEPVTAAGEGDGSSGGGTEDGAGDDSRDDDNGAPPLPAGCPDEWPNGWVFCEDFETLDDPLDSFSQYASADGALAIDARAGALRADYREGVEEAGWVLVSFGASPVAHEGGTTHASEARFEEIYWRVKVKHELGWPDVGPGVFGRASAFAGEDWSEALVAELRSSAGETTLEAVPLTCVNGEAVFCDGYNDASSLEELDKIVGKTPLFSSKLSGEWHCVEAHVRLNERGVADGVFEFWIDDELQNSRVNIVWRGDWAEYGLNAVTLDNFWPGGARADLTRWMDDVVVSTEPIGCD